MKRFIFLLLCVTSKLVAQTPIAPTFYGINAWMPDTMATTFYNGKLHQDWQKVKTTAPKTVRIGGIAADQHFYTNFQILKLVDSIRSIGAEPIVQVPVWRSSFSATNAAQIVNFLNVINGRNIKYFSIGNEPNLVYNDASRGFPSSGYSTPQYAADVKAFSVAMKTIDPAIKIIAGEMAWYDYTWVNALLGGADDISGKDVGTNRDYIDIFSFHTYPFGSTAQTRTDVVNAISTFETNLTHLKGKLTTINNAATRLGSLSFAVTEFNVNWQNPLGDGVTGVGSNSFIGGQWLANIVFKAAARGAAFINFWSIAEGGDGSRTDIGYISHTTGNLKPMYHHFNLMSNYFKGDYYAANTNQTLVKSGASKDADGWTIVLTNFDETTDYNFTLRLDAASPSTSNPLIINVPTAGISREMTELLPKNSTIILFLSPKGYYRSKILYRSTDAQSSVSPVFSSYIPTRQKRVFAHYLPWYDIASSGFGTRLGWCYSGASCSDGTIQNHTYTPLIGEYSQYDSEVLKYHIRQAQAARIDGFIVNVNPSDDYQWYITQQLCNAALQLKSECGARDFKIIISYDNSTATDLTSVQSLFQIVKNKFYNQSAYSSLVFKDDITQKPVIMAWSDAAPSVYLNAINNVFGEDEMFYITRNATNFAYSDANFEWVGYLNSDRSNTISWGEPYFNDMNWIMARQTEFGLSSLKSANTLKMAGVYPGFDDRNVPSFWAGGAVRYISRQVTAGETMALTWNRAITYTPLSIGGTVAVDAPWVQLVTWNDFPEGTNIEPSILSQEGYKALQTNRLKIAQFKGISTNTEDTVGIYVPYSIFIAMKTGRTADATNALSDLCNSNYSSALLKANASVLPLELLRFDGKKLETQNQLTWQIEDVSLLQNFEIEQSFDGHSFQKIAELAPPQYSIQKVDNYTFVDEKPFLKTYYRLKMVMKDGSSAFSKIILLEREGRKEAIIYPNPAANELYIETAMPQTISILDINGKIIFEKKMNEVVEKLDITAFPSGLYLVKMGVEVKRFIKL